MSTSPSDGPPSGEGTVKAKKRGRPKGQPLSSKEKAQRQVAALKTGEHSSRLLGQALPPCKPATCPAEGAGGGGYPCSVKETVEARGGGLAVCLQRMGEADSVEGFRKAILKGDTTAIAELAALSLAGYSRLEQDEIEKVLGEGLTAERPIIIGRDEDGVPEMGVIPIENPRVGNLLELLQAPRTHGQPAGRHSKGPGREGHERGRGQGRPGGLHQRNAPAPIGEPRVNAVELLHPALPELMDELLAHNGWSWEAVAAGRVDLNGEPVTIDSLQWLLIELDPVLWTECNLLNRTEDGDGFWTLFDYQKPSLRFRGHVVHQDGAEVGKSREIVALTLWALTAAAKGSVLVGSARDGDLDEIWDEIQFQVSANPHLGSRIVRQTTKPYRRLTMDNGLKALFRPAGHDGQAFRGVHVGGMALHDEAVKVQNPTAWREFWRAAKPGCEIRLYSVPNGDRACTFQRIADNATPCEQVLRDPSPRAIVEGLLRNPKTPSASKKLSRDLGGRVWVRFHWPKTIMPAPFWSEERRQEFIGLFGSPDDPGYIHNVLGLPGDPEYSVFPSRLLDPAIRYIPDYLSVLLIWDHNARKVQVEVKRLNPAYGRPEYWDESPLHSLAEEESTVVPPLLLVDSESIDVGRFDTLSKEEKRDFITGIVARVVKPLPGLLTGGIDFGSSSVTEIAIERGLSSCYEWVLRLSARGFGYAEQAFLIRAVDQILAPAEGWGADATGVGKPVVDILQGEGDTLANRLSGFVFNMKTPALNEDDGEPLVDPLTKQPLQLTWKEQGTQLLERALSAHKKVLPSDPELLFLLQNHTFSESASGARVYNKNNDHVADAWRCLALRRLMRLYGTPSAPPLIVIPSGRQIDSMAIHRML